MLARQLSEDSPGLDSALGSQRYWPVMVMPLIEANWMAPGMKGDDGPRWTTPQGDGFSLSMRAPCPRSRQPYCTTETTGRIEAECLASRRSWAPCCRWSSVVLGGCGHEENAEKLPSQLRFRAGVSEVLPTCTVPSTLYSPAGAVTLPPLQAARARVNASVSSLVSSLGLAPCDTTEQSCGCARVRGGCDTDARAGGWRRTSVFIHGPQGCFEKSPPLRAEDAGCCGHFAHSYAGPWNGRTHVIG